MSHKKMRLRIDNDVVAYQYPSHGTIATGTTMTQAEQHDATQAPTETTTAAGRSAPTRRLTRTCSAAVFSSASARPMSTTGRSRRAKVASTPRNPLDVWRPLPARQPVCGGPSWAEIVSRHDDDSKIAAARITISAEIALPQIISDGVAYLMGRCQGACGDNSQLASGDCSQLAGYGDKLAASGVMTAGSPPRATQPARRLGTAATSSPPGYDSSVASGYGSKLATSGLQRPARRLGNDSRLRRLPGYQLAASGNDSQLAASGGRLPPRATTAGSPPGYDSRLAASGYGRLAARAATAAAARATADRPPGRLQPARRPGDRSKLAARAKTASASPHRLDQLRERCWRGNRTDLPRRKALPHRCCLRRRERNRAERRLPRHRCRRVRQGAGLTPITS